MRILTITHAVAPTLSDLETMAELRCLFRSSPRALSRISVASSPKKTRSFATEVHAPVTPGSAARRLVTSFKDKLNSGPSFGDFVGGEEVPLSQEDALELKTAMVGPPGKKKAITRLPEWLRTPVPVGDNFKKIRNDLRGLNLHTGK